MGLLDAMQQPQQEEMGGLLGGAPQAQAGIGQMPPEMIRVIEQIKQAPPEQQEQLVQQIVQTIQGMPKEPGEIQQAVQQFMQAVSQG